MSSIIDSLKKLLLQQRPTLFTPHPLAKLTHNEKLSYLSFVALPIAVNRPSSELETSAFLALSQRLDMDEHEGQKIWQERNTMLSHDIAKGLVQLVQQDRRWHCLCDSIWIQIQQPLDPEDQQTTQYMAQLLGINAPLLTQLYQIMSSVLAHNTVEALRQANRLPAHATLYPLLKQAIAGIPRIGHHINNTSWQNYHLRYRTKLAINQYEHHNEVFASFTADGNQLMVLYHATKEPNSSSDTLAQLGCFDSRHGERIKTVKLQGQIDHGPDHKNHVCTFSPDGNWLFYSYTRTGHVNGRTNFVHNTFSGECLYVTHDIERAHFSLDNRFLGFKGSLLNLNHLKMHHLQDARIEVAPILGFNHAMSRHKDGGIALWDLHTGNYLKHLSKNSVNLYAISPDEEWVLIDKLEQLNINTGNMRWQHCVDADLSLPCYSPDGAWLAAIFNDVNVVIYHAATGERVALFAHNTPSPCSLSFSPDSQQLLISGGGYYAKAAKYIQSFCVFSCQEEIEAE